jgi:hypothetical protein
MSMKPVIEESPPGLSFREKSLWISLLSTVAVYVYYFWRALAVGDRDPARAGMLFAMVVVLLIAVQVVGHVALAVHRRPEREDERDRRIATLAARNGYYVLMTGVWFGLGVAALSLGTFWYAHALLLAVVVAEVVKSGSQLVYHRRGI